ncbi:MAG: phenylphosphate synthase subunit beta [Deltaproteobacteria bacterium]|nr:MAG: phenylphosphate synthase subunit beta [Deltaproteobacteria bacterium]
MAYILNFKELDKTSIPSVGGKNASLGEMIKAGIRVPPGFAVTTTCYEQFILGTEIKDDIFGLLADLDPDDVDALNTAASRVRALIIEATITPEIADTIKEGYHQLCRQCGLDSIPVAVRSSATAEDLPTASFAGQQDTYLWIEGADNVLNRVQRCWASLFTARAIAYRTKNNFPHDKVLISVGVQQMVNSRAAGVMFTLNPIDGDPSKVVIEGSWGLGETVVSGTVNPDRFVVDKVVMETSEKTVSAKHIECIFDHEKAEVINADVSEERQSVCCLADQEVKALATVAKIIEKHYGRPMDIEWAIDGTIDFPDNIFIVQARPETVWGQREKKSVLGNKSGYQLLMEQAMKRIKIP